MSNYDNKYSEWKRWSDDNFAICKNTEYNYFRKELSKVPLVINAEIKILEIGFGSGNFIKYCIDNSLNISGVEANAQLLALADKNSIVAYHSDDFYSLPSCSYNLVVAFDVLEHIPKSELQNFLNNISRVLKKNGVFLARFPNGDSPFGLAHQNGDITHTSFIGSGMIRQLANGAEFSSVNISSQATILFEGSIKLVMWRFISRASILFLDIIYRFIFYPRRNYFSQNLIAILIK